MQVKTVLERAQTTIAQGTQALHIRNYKYAYGCFRSCRTELKEEHPTLQQNVHSEVLAAHTVEHPRGISQEARRGNSQCHG